MGEQQTGSNYSNNGSKKNTVVVIVALVVVAALAGGIWWWHELRVTVSTDDAQVTGNIADISPKIAGRLDRIFVSEGDTVSAGQKLAELDTASAKVAMNQAEAALELAKANYAKLPDDIKSAQATADKAQQALTAAQAQVKSDQFSLDDANRALNQTDNLYSSGAASKEALDSARSKKGSAQARLEADQANVLAAQASLQDAQARLEAVNNTSAATYQAALKQAQANYDSAKLNYDNSFIYATISGTVVRVPAVVGENLSPGTAILSISDLQSSWVVANVEEGSYGRLRPGQKAEVKVDAYPGKVLAGQVIELGGATQSTFSLIPTQNDSGNFTKVTQRMPVKIEIGNKDGLILKPGMSVEVTIHTV